MDTIELWESEIAQEQERDKILKEETIYNFYDNISINESRQEIVSEKEINFFGKKAKIKIRTNNPDSKLMNNIDKVLKAICMESLYNYLYKLNKDFYTYEINEEPYFKGKQINSGKDLYNSIDITDKNTSIFVCDDKYRKCIYFAGEYWVDDEHGFSITFPNGKFVRAGKDGKTVNSNYVPIATGIGQYSDCF